MEGQLETGSTKHTENEHLVTQKGERVTERKREREKRFEVEENEKEERRLGCVEERSLLKFNQ